jgi:hypothetical protein
MTNRNRRAAEKFATFGEVLEDATTRAKTTVGKSIGKSIQRRRLAGLGPMTSKRRKDGVTFKITRRGTLVMLDLAPMAVPQEFGRVIMPENGEYLRVPIGGGDNRKRIKGDSTFVVRDRKGNLLVMRDLGGGSAEPIATLRTSVVIKRNAPSGRFATAVDAELKNYKNELAAELIKELRKK